MSDVDFYSTIVSLLSFLSLPIKVLLNYGYNCKRCQKNATYLNFDKYSSISFSLNRIPIKLHYSLGNVILLRVYKVLDIGVESNCKL